MKWCRWGSLGRERLGVISPDGVRRDASKVGEADDVVGLAAGGESVSGEDLARLPELPASERYGAVVPRPGKIICIGLNYRDHAEEAGMEVPAEPIIFLKAPNTVVGPNDDILIPRGSHKTDWEVELGVVIGRQARYLENETQALGCVAGYCISHDVSEREFQLERGGQWGKGKSCDTFNPLGPWLVTPDEISDVQALSMRLAVNGQTMQNGNTSTMIFSVAFTIHYLSQFMTIEPGDLITPGTPPGVGLGLTPPRYLQPNAVVPR